MKNRMGMVGKLVFSGILTVVFLFGQITPTMAEEKDVKAQEPIGVVSVIEINDLTGPTSETCVIHHNAIWDLIRETNAQGGIIYDDPKTGKKERAIIELKWGDNKAQAGPVPTLYSRLAMGKNKPVILTTGSSAAAITVPPWAERDHIVHINPTGAQQGWYPPRWSFTLSPDYPSVACATAEWAMADWKKKGHTEAPGWAWFTMDIPFGRAPIKPESEAYIKGLGFKMVGTWTMPYRPVDTGPQIRSMIAAGANYCYGNLAFSQLHKVMKDITRLKAKDKLQVLSIFCATSREDSVKEVGGEEMVGAVSNHFTAMIDEFDKPGVKWGHDLEVKKYNRIWSSDTIMALGWANVIVESIRKALENKGYPITGDDVFEAMFSPEGFDSGGLIPKIVFTENERRGIWKVHMRKVVEGGKVVRLTEDFDLPNIQPTPSK